MKKGFILGRGYKRAILILYDVLAIAFCFWLAMALRLDGLFTEIPSRAWTVLVAVIPSTILMFFGLGLYRVIVRYMTDRGVYLILIGATVSAIVMFAVSQFFSLNVPRSVPGIYLALVLVVIIGARFSMRSLFLSLKDRNRIPVLIYGAGEVGRQLLSSLEQSNNYRPSFFIDDNPKLENTEIRGIRVFNRVDGEKHAHRLGIKTALLALSDREPETRRVIAQRLASWGVEVKVIPNILDLVSGRVRISNLRRITVEELLGREPVLPMPEYMSATTLGRSVMVTGAGGSIGSELCRQILQQGPKKLTLFEASEPALYHIYEELIDRCEKMNLDAEIVPVLGSVVNEESVRRAFSEHDVENVYHAAAYKHVPLVESNMLEGLRNNVLGTLHVARLAGQMGVEHFTLISTDKAVRPTNVMGATKRVAELVMQANAKQYAKTKYCAVRFGNVLGSSGSVIPKFESQIQAGGPITLTHPEINRYFMTIPEAAQLVIQASAMSVRGEIYLLDMGRPIKILDLARTMARTMGRDTFIEGVEPANVDAIAIKITGLRPGEKLYEELLVTGDEQPTLHPRVRAETSNLVDLNQVDAWLEDIHRMCNEGRSADVVPFLSELPIEYSSEQSRLFQGKLTASA